MKGTPPGIRCAKERWQAERDHSDDGHLTGTAPKYQFPNKRDDFNEMVSLPVVQLCFSAEELILIHELEANASSDMGRSGLARLSPALLQQILSGACTNTTDSHVSDGLSVTESQCVFWPLMTSNLL